MPMNPKSMLYNISMLSASGVLLQMMGFAYQVMLSRLADTQALGLYQLVVPVYAVVMAATVSGVRMAVTSLCAGLSPTTQIPRIRVLVRSAIRSFLGLFALVGLPALFLHDFLALYIIGEPETSSAVLFMLICVFLTGFEGIFESLFLGIGKTKYTAISNLLEQGVKIPLILLMLFACGESGNFARTASLIALGMALSEIPVLVWLLSVYQREIRRHGVIPPHVEKPRILSVAVPVSAACVLTNLLSSASVILLPVRLGVSGMSKTQAMSALGVISEMALPMMLLPMVLIRALSNVLLPNVSMNVSKGNRMDVGRKIQKSFQATGLIVLPATAILIPISIPLARLLYHQELEAPYIWCIAAAAVLAYFEVISASILNGLGKQRTNMVCLVMGESIQLFCTYFLAARPELQMYGYLIGMIAGPLVVLLTSLVLIRCYSGYTPRFDESFLIPLLASGVAGGFTRYFYQSGAGPEALRLGVAATLGAGVCCLSLLLGGMRPFRYFKTLCVSERE